MNALTTRTLAMLLLLFAMSGAMAQQIDDARMERDLKIAENILGTLSSEGDERSQNYFFGHNTKSSFVEGYGVIFNIPSNRGVFYVNQGSSSERVVIRESGNGYTYSVPPPPPKVKSARNSKQTLTTKEFDIDSLEKAGIERSVGIMKMFLADYADLIGQLKPTDHIMVTTKSTIAASDFSFRTSRRSDTGVTTEVLKSDLSSYKVGKMSRDQLLSKITITKDEKSTEKVADLELLASIFERLYKSDLSNTYYCSGGGVRYEKLKNFGVIMSMKVYSSNNNDGFYTIQTQGLSNLSKQERDEKVESLYPEFEQTLKENIIDYGRTVKSLQPNEMLMFKVKLTECNACDMPKSIDISVNASVLMDYDKGKIDKKAALSKIKVKKY